MPRRGLVSGGPDALALLKLASEIPQDSFSALRDAAIIAVSIIETITTFASNVKKGRWCQKYKDDCASCAKYVENASTNVMLSLGSQDPPGKEEVTGKMNELLESLEKVKGEISGMQQASLLGRIPSSGKDRQSIADMKAQVQATLTRFGPLLGATYTLDGMDAEQFLARIMERYKGTTAVAPSVNRDNESVADRNTSEHTSELAIVRFDEATPLVERSSNRTGSVSVAREIPSPSDCANEHVIGQTMPVFNTTTTSGATINNITGDYYGYGPSDEQFVLDKLLGAEGASWDPKRVCLPGTRVNILAIIHASLRSLDAPNVFWLNGVAGAGKSAIAHTIAQALHADGLLASSFFFDRNDASRNTPRRLFTTIARDIAMHHPAIAADIRTALENEPSLASAALSRQFEAFISGPLHRHPVDHPIVVVIDALDEAIGDDSDTSLLAILRGEASHLPPQLRILITAQSTRIVAQYLSEQTHITSHPIDIHSPDNRRDIAVYVDAQLRDPLLRSRMGPNWPDEAVIHELKIMAEGLFIWIATVCSYLCSVYNPREKLEALLSKSTPQGLAASKKMDILYALILELCADWKDADFLKDYDLVMGAIMAAKRPLSLMALKALHGANHPMELSADILLERFGSVLVGFKTDHEPIRMLHVSFREFITNNANSAEHTRQYYISEKLHSQRLAALCLQTMVRELADGRISGTGYLGRDNDDPPGIPEVTGVSEQLIYSCESWSNHISDVTKPNPTIFQHLQAFLRHHATGWLEVVSSKSIFLGSLPVFCWLKDQTPEIRQLCDDKSHASALSSLSNRLAYAGRLREALTANQEVVDLRRELAVQQPALFNASLALSLINLSTNLSAVGQTEEALTAVQEAVELYRTLAGERPTMFNAPLTNSLIDLSVRLSGVGQAEEALTADQEVVDLRRALAVERPALFNASLALSLINLATNLSTVSRTEEALTAVQEAVELYRTLAADQPAMFNAPLTNSLTNLSVRLSAVGQAEEAVTAVQEAVHLHRTLAAGRPAVFNAPLTNSLTTLSVRLSAVGQTEEALIVDQEVVDLRRALAVERPAVFNVSLAHSLINLSTNLSAVGRTEEALTAVQEAVGLHRTLAEGRPTLYNSALARTLTWQSTITSNMRRGPDE